jgi:hypothetical protein
MGPKPMDKKSGKSPSEDQHIEYSDGGSGSGEINKEKVSNGGDQNPAT